MAAHDPSAAPGDATHVKDLFGLLLDAEEATDPAEAAQLREAADAALARVDAAARQAVEQLLAAHRRAAGVLLEPTHSAGDDGDAASRPVDDGALITIEPPVIAGYEVGEEIGRGGFGVVYRARQVRPVERDVAVKVLRNEFATAEVIGRFRAEARLLARMNHPGIARVLDAGLDDRQRPFVTMELVRGEPLVQYCQSHQLTIRQRVRLMRDVAEAVHHAHQRAVIHRDLKPANVLVERIDDRHQPHVIDFGIAKLVGDGAADVSWTRTGTRLGTPRYMSPEQESSADVSDVRTDVYALGVMLCEALTGDVPHQRDDAGSAGSSRSRTRTVRPSQLAARAGSAGVTRSRVLRGDLDRIVLKAAALDSEIRYDSAAALAEDLERYLDGRPVRATPPSAVYLARTFIARRKVTSAAIVVALIALIGGTAAAMYGRNRATASEAKAVAAQMRAETEAENANEVNTFWLDIIERGSPREARQPDLSVREALDLAAPRVDAEIDNVQVRRRLHETFADAYHALGLSEPQLEHARAAFELLGESSAATLEASIRTHLLYGRALMESNELPVARSVLLEARSMCTSNDPSMRRYLPEVLQTLARVSSSEGAFADAESLLLDAVEQAEATLGPRHPVTLEAEEKLGLTLVKLGRYQEVVDRLVPVLEAQQDVLGNDHPDTLGTRTVLATARVNLGRLDEAERDYQVLIAQSIAILGEDHSHILALKHNRAGLLRKMSRQEEAMAQYDAVRAAYERTGGPDHPNTLSAAFNLAIVLSDLERFEESESLLIDIVARRTRVLGADHPGTINAQQTLATVYYYTDRLDEAEAQYVDILERLRRVVPPGAMHLAPVLRNYGAVLRDLGRPDEALPMFIGSYEILVSAVGEDHPETTRGLAFICETLDELESPDDGILDEWRRRCSNVASDD